MRGVIPLILAAAVGLAGCSRVSPEERWTAAETARVQRAFDVALQNYTALLEDHPASAQAEPAAMSIASIYNNELRDFPKAIEAYKNYLRLFPDADAAPVARFMVGFIYHNELKQLDSAGVWFRTFLDRHPDHEMASSARFELENLGRSPDELVPHDTAGSARVTAARPAAR